MPIRTDTKARPSIELLSEHVYRVLAHPLVLLLARTPVAPTQVVMAHTLVGAWGAWQLWQGHFWQCALALQIKTILDAVDGQLARRTKQESEIGRYLDTVMDFWVNVALFAALQHTTQLSWWLIVPAFLLFTLMQSWDFNVEYLYRLARQQGFRPSVTDARQGWDLKALKAFYQWWFLPQDRYIRTLEQKLANPLNPTQQLAFWSAKAHSLYVNFGLASLHAAMSVLLALQQPQAIVWSSLAIGLYLPLSYVLRYHWAKLAV